MSDTVVLVNFYSPKSLGVRYLEGALRAAGFDAAVVFFKGFHSTRPQKPTDAEVDALVALLRRKNPLFIGFSVMSSLYLDAVTAVSRAVREQVSDVPLVWGGVYPTLFPERCLQYCDYVLRGEGEGAVAELARRLRDGADASDTENLAFLRGGETVVNPVRPLIADLDALPIAEPGSGEKYSINGVLRAGDPSMSSIGYETSCSRGCPFNCSYCSVSALKGVYRGQGRYLRFRSAGNVVEELAAAKAVMKNLSFVHFWDEIFPSEPEWIKEFAERYRAEVGLPFEIWAHPQTTSLELITALKRAGLYQVTMGVQSGSPRVRREVFRRAETQEQVMAAARVLADARLPYVTYDFILRHPFESAEEIRETYELCARLPGRFTLNMHGLNLLPGTDISEEAVARGLYTREELEGLMYAPMERQYATWWEDDCADPRKNFWYHLTYLTQSALYGKKAARLAQGGESDDACRAAARCYAAAKRLERPRHIWLKGKAVLRGKLK
jgi:radical SAM superfamily enzyme YgiQ (UPF0313 family)